MYKGDDYKLHAAGREYIDMLGSCMLFLVEIQNACYVPSEVSIKEMKNKTKSQDSNLGCFL